LKKVKRPEVIKRIAAARELGDLSENADYDDARDEQSFIEGRIFDLEKQLNLNENVEISITKVGKKIIIDHYTPDQKKIDSFEFPAGSGKSYWRGICDDDRLP